MKNRFFSRFLVIAILCTAASAVSTVRAQEIPKEIEAQLDYDDYIYENASMEKFAQLYWALGRLDINNDQHIDNFLMISECAIYKKYNQNEFEWDSIRDAARKFIEQNKANFPIRFEIMQPLYLGKYDFDKRAFEVIDGYKIDGVRRFEVLVKEEEVCGIPASRYANYPDGLVVELSRPIVMTHLKMEPERAEQFILQKQEQYKDVRKVAHNMDIYRDSYVVMNIRFFTSQGDAKISSDGHQYANLLGVLEGIRVYADADKKELLYEENYQRQKSPEAASDETEKSLDDFVKRREEAKKKLEQKKASEDGSDESAGGGEELPQVDDSEKLPE